MELRVLAVALICSSVPCHVSCFNLSPTPNVIFRKPVKETFMEQTESSYFGYSITLQNENIFVGAPKAQSTAPEQKSINTTGAVYKCNFSSGSCKVFNFDAIGNVGGKLKDFQMLGASMDGLESNLDNFVVCAPKLNIVDLRKKNWLMHGICYTVGSTNASDASRPKQIFLETPNKESYMYKYHYPEVGFSSHVSNDQKEIIMGCPGAYSWRGSILRYDVTKSKGNVPDTRMNDEFDELDHTYFGYAVTTIKISNDKLLYVASAPRNKNLDGEVFVFELVSSGLGVEQKIKVHSRLSGVQFGDYFGYAILAEDFNNDGNIDIAVSAPMHEHGPSNTSHDRGAVYVYRNDGNVRKPFEKFNTSI